MAWSGTDVLQASIGPVGAISLVRMDLEAIDAAVAKYWDVSHADDPDVRRGREPLGREVCERVRDYFALESAFVRAVAGSVADEALPREMRAAQGQALELVAAIEQAAPDDPQRDAALRVLGEFMLRHGGGELEGVFRHVAASRIDLFELGDRLRQQRAAGFALG